MRLLDVRAKTCRVCRIVRLRGVDLGARSFEHKRKLHGDVDRLAVLDARFEPPLRNGFETVFSHIRIRRVQNSQIPGRTVAINDQLDFDPAIFERQVVGELRLLFTNGIRPAIDFLNRVNAIFSFKLTGDFLDLSTCHLSDEAKWIVVIHDQLVVGLARRLIGQR